jgi:hypothetical protein
VNAAIRKNPVFWLMWFIPAAAVFGGLGMVAVAMQGADRALPPIYHWEGELLDADFERARVAARQGIEARLGIAGGECRLALTGSAAPVLTLVLTNGTDVRLDRSLSLTRGADGLYHAPCAPLESGRWRASLEDAARTWSLRTRMVGAGETIEMKALAPQGPAT